MVEATPAPVSSGVLLTNALPITRVEGVSLAAADAAGLAAFWKLALGDDPASLAGVRVTEGIPSATEQGRTQLAVRLGADGPSSLLAAGGSLVSRPGPDPWWVLADPEGNTFRAWPPAAGRPRGVFELLVRCHCARRLAYWWGRLLGGDVHDEGSASVVTGMPGFPWDFLVFDRTSKPKRAPNRVQWSVRLRESGPDALVAVGAVVLQAFAGRWLMADPEGNEFSAYAASPFCPAALPSRPAALPSRPVGRPAADRTPAAGLAAALPEKRAVKQNQADHRAERDDDVPKHVRRHAAG